MARFSISNLIANLDHGFRPGGWDSWVADPARISGASPAVRSSTVTGDLTR
jgi:hypothetical protein